MATKLTEAYVLGLLAAHERRVPELTDELRVAQKRASTIDGELGTLIERADMSRQTARQAAQTSASAAQTISDHNLRTSQLHQEVASLNKKSDDLKLEMDRVGAGAIQRRLRRERAKLRVQTEDRDAEIDVLRSEVDAQRDALQVAEQTETEEKDRQRLLTVELDKLQALLPRPQLYCELFEESAARAHCRLLLDGDASQWNAELRDAIDSVEALHRELRAGKYRLDKNSEIVGGRSTATAEAVYGCVAIGDLKRGHALFELATDPALYFHQIFNVFRVWALGLFLEGRTTELAELLRTHQFAEGLRGGYVEAFIGLLKGDSARVNRGLARLTKYEWEGWQDPSRIRGVGVVNVGAVALLRLAKSRGLAARIPGATVPKVLVTLPKRAAGVSHLPS